MMGIPSEIFTGMAIWMGFNFLLMAIPVAMVIWAAISLAGIRKELAGIREVLRQREGDGDEG